MFGSPRKYLDQIARDNKMQWWYLVHIQDVTDTHPALPFTTLLLLMGPILAEGNKSFLHRPRYDAPRRPKTRTYDNRERYDRATR